MTDKPISKFVKDLVPEDADIVFLHKGDINGDGREEVLVGISYFDVSKYIYTMYLIYLTEEGPEHKLFLTTVENRDSLYDSNSDILGAIADVFIVDTNGDGSNELVICTTMGTGHYVTVFIFHWNGRIPVLVWKSDLYAQGIVDVIAPEKDGGFSITVESRTFSEDMNIFCHYMTAVYVTESCLIKWDGNTYAVHPLELRDENIRHNISVRFLESVWNEDYLTAYTLVELPAYLGLRGLDECSFQAFEAHAKQYVRPVLAENLNGEVLSQVEHCLFQGKKNEFYFRFSKMTGSLKIEALTISPAAV
jgi:hypothetical protein